MQEYQDILEMQKAFFMSGATRSYAFRMRMLERLSQALEKHEPLLLQALKKDLGKSETESYMCEIGLVKHELSFHKKHLKKWMKARKVRTPISQFPAKSHIIPEPYGVVLIMAPWNYPVQLCLMPLIGAISAGNCALLKPSAYAEEVSHALADMIRETFPPEYIQVVEGGRTENQALIHQPFDHIFFTGSVAVGREVMKAAAEHLTPLTLELGGKSPVIVEKTADVALAAKRIAFGKLLNAGQTCVAPDYVLLPRELGDDFRSAYGKAVESFFPGGQREEMPSIIHPKHMQRLSALLEGQNAVLGGQVDWENSKIAPTLLWDVSPDAPVMQQEIFGPILPVILYDEWEWCLQFVCERPKPLALYLFTRDGKKQKEVFDRCSFGGGCVNDTVVHLATPYMPFGGVGESGMGGYHGKDSFDTFSHNRSILYRGVIPDLSVRYHPYTKKKDRLLRFLLK